MTAISIGRLLRANTTGCIMGCRLSQATTPAFGEMVRIPLDDGTMIYGLVHEIFIDDDGLVRQLVSSEVSAEVIEDNRKNRNVPVEISVVFIGWENASGQVFHTRIPTPPLALDEIFRCNEQEIQHFTAGNRLGYLRALLRNEEIPAVDLVTAHMKQVLSVTNVDHATAWRDHFLNEIIALLKDDYPQLLDVLSTISTVIE